MEVAANGGTLRTWAPHPRADPRDDAHPPRAQAGTREAVESAAARHTDATDHDDGNCAHAR